MAITLPNPATLIARWTERKNARQLSKQQLDGTRKSALFQVEKAAQIITEHSSHVLNALFEGKLKGLPENVCTEFRMEFRSVQELVRRQVRLVETLNYRYEDLSMRQYPFERYQSLIKSYQAAFKSLAVERNKLDELLAKIDTRREQLSLRARKVRFNTAKNRLQVVGSLLFSLRHATDAKDLTDCHDKLHRRMLQLQERLYGEPAITPGVFGYEQERSRNDIERLHRDISQLEVLVIHRVRMLGEENAEPVSLRK